MRKDKTDLKRNELDHVVLKHSHTLRVRMRRLEEFNQTFYSIGAAAFLLFSSITLQDPPSRPFHPPPRRAFWLKWV
jgi:hypothetical protein